MQLRHNKAVHRTAAAATAAALITTLAACSTPAAEAEVTDMSLWIWPGGVSETVLEEVVAEFPDYGIEVSVIGDDFRQKLVTTFTGGSGIPSITGVKGENMPYFLTEDSLFHDFNELGVDDLLDDFPAWKLAEATTADGRLIGIPIDIGPTGMYYRADVFADAGLPSEPDEVAAATATWEDYLEFGVALKAANGSDISVATSSIFGAAIGQLEEKFVSADGEFLGESDGVRGAWDIAVEAYELGITAGISDGSPDWAAAINEGSLSAAIGAAWYQGDIKGAAADTAGDWRVAASPGGPANIGGSFLTIPADNESPQAAVEVIRWLLSPENQAAIYGEIGNFPASLSALDLLTDGDDFFGGQNTVEVFKQATLDMPTGFNSPFDNEVAAPYYNELSNIESLGKDPEQAWNDAVAAATAAWELTR
jgi:cellobiose transport system substrate-binding protein